MPDRILTRLGRLWRWEYSGLCLGVLVTLALHFSVIMQPAELAFDEQHYVKDARSIIAGNDTERPEHPPLGKLFIVAGILIFGDNPFGWRIFSVVFGTLIIVFFYLLCRRLMSREASLLATFLLSLENLSFVQASVAMLDVFSLAFTMLAFWLYLKGRYISSGLSIGLSALAKLNGALAGLVIGLYWLLAQRTKNWRVLLTGLVTPVSFLLLMPLFDYAVSRSFMNPIERVKTMMSLSGSLTFSSVTSDVLSRPWEWVLLPKIMFYWYTPHYIGAISFNIWALIIPVIIYMVVKAIKGSHAACFGLAWFAGTYLFWIPASILTDRISFVFYFYPAVGAICLGLGLGLSRLLEVGRTHPKLKFRRAAKISVWGYLVVHAAIFVILAPVFSRWLSLIPIPS